MDNAQEKKVSETLEILTAIGFPLSGKSPKMQRRLARIFLSVCNVKPQTPWSQAAVWSGKDSWAVRSRDIIRFINQYYGEKIADSSYDDIRRKNLDYLVQGGLVLSSPGRPHALTNDGTRNYAVNPSAKKLLRKFGAPKWAEIAAEFVAAHGNFTDLLERKREQQKNPLKLPGGVEVLLATGAHNDLQRAIVKEFLPRFVPSAQVLYIGDSAQKELFKDVDGLTEIAFFEVAHDRLPDIIAYDKKRNWLFLIEAVHTSNPISKLRHIILERAAAACSADVVFVSVFADRKSFSKWILDISWETEVWLVESPEHMIHFNGDRFLGPHKKDHHRG